MAFSTPLLLLAWTLMPATAAQKQAGHAVPARSPVQAVQARKGDLAEIKKSGELRALMTENPMFKGLQRGMSPRDHDEALLLSLADNLGVTLKIVYVATFSELIPSLLSGAGDIVADNITINERRKQIMAFSQPTSSVRNFIVAGSSNKSIRSTADLAGRMLTIEAGTSYWADAKKLAKTVPSLKLSAAAPGIDTEELLCGVATGAYELALADSNYVDSFLTYCPNIKIVHQFDNIEQTAWGIRKENPELLRAVNDLLKSELTEFAPKLLKGDLPEIKKRKTLRVLTRNNLYCYYLAKDEPHGFERDLAVEFAKRQKLTAVMIVPPKWGDVIPWLIDGRGDVVAAQMTITPERVKAPEVAFCTPYCEAREAIIARPSDTISSASGLAGRKIFVRRRSSYWRSLSQLGGDKPPFQLLAVPEDMDTSEIMEKVSKGEYDLTMVDDQIAKNEIASGRKLKIAFTLGEPRRYGWLTRREDKLLRGEIDAFFKKEYRGLFYNLSYRKSYTNASEAKRLHDMRESGTVGADGAISKYDAIIKKHAAANKLDWLLVAAQIKQESGFDPTLINDFDCHGLMQLSKPTIKLMKCKDPMSPEENISIGTQFLKKMRDRFEPDIDEEDRMCFALASYNAGYGHVYDARLLAAKLKLDDRKWFGNVETALECLSKPEYASKAKYGYCRSSETIPYVRDIYYRCRDYRQNLGKQAR